MATANADAASTRVGHRPQIRAFRALCRAYAKLTEEHRRHLTRRHDLVLSEFDMIAALGNTQGLRMGELANAMITSPANVTRVAQALERRGFVERQRADHSDREVIARLTPAGDEFFRKHFFEVVAFTSALFDSALTVAEQNQLAKLLGKLFENAKAPPADVKARSIRAPKR